MQTLSDVCWQSQAIAKADYAIRAKFHSAGARPSRMSWRVMKLGPDTIASLTTTRSCNAIMTKLQSARLTLICSNKQFSRKITKGEQMLRSYFLAISIFVILGSWGLKFGGVGILCSPTCEAQDIRPEDIAKLATPAWTKFRERQFDASQYALKWESSFKNRPSDEWQTHTGDTIRYSSGALKVSHTTDDPTTSSKGKKDLVLGVNPNYAFLLERKEDLDWRVVDVEPLLAKLEPWTSKDLEIKQMVSNRPIKAIRVGATSDQRLEFNSRPIEFFMRDRKRMFHGVEARTDPQLGNIVTLKLFADEETDEEVKTRTGAARGKIDGFIEFLRDHEWLILSYEFNSTMLHADGSVISSLHTTMTSEYDTSRKDYSLAKSISVEYLSSRGASHKEKFEYRPLSSEEASEAKSRCYLSGFELPEPEGNPGD